MQQEKPGSEKRNDMFEKSNFTDAARSCGAGGELLRRRGLLPFFMALLAALTLTGCRTYYGYDDIKENFRDTMPDGAPRDVRRYAVVTAEDGEASLKCFCCYDLPKNAMTGVRIIGRKEFYSDYEAGYYFENSPYNAGWNKNAWLFSIAYFFLTDKKYIDGNPLLYLVPAFGQVFLAWDLSVFMVASCVDSCLFIGRCCWTGVSSSCVWLCGRAFGWMGDWHLAEHKPGVLRMTSYMPFINFFMFQTPPYMTNGHSFWLDEEVQYDVSDYKVVKRTQIVTVVPRQEFYTGCQVVARVLCNGELCGSREFRTDDHGEVKLTEFLRKCVDAAPLAARDFSLEIKLSDEAGRELLTRKVDFTAEQVMSAAAARDLAAYRAGDTDQLNKLLLSRRSHREWRRELFAGELAIPKPGAERK